jgi:hypothetical protein
MVFEKPILFEDAVRSAKVKALLPTTLSSAELAPIRLDIAKTALASARVYEARFLSDLASVVESMLSPLEREDGNIQGMNLAEARTNLKAKLKEYGYEPPEGERDRITDLSSDQRLNLMVETQVDLNRGYGQWRQGQDEDILDVWPAQELYRAEPREEPRDWDQIWDEAASRVDPAAHRVFKETNRKVALKDSPIWLTISDFGVPYPPFKFNSGMKVEDVERDAAISLGLMSPNRRVRPEEADHYRDFSISAPEVTPEMQEQILDTLGPEFAFKEGVLTRR